MTGLNFGPMRQRAPPPIGAMECGWYGSEHCNVRALSHNVKCGCGV